MSYVQTADPAALGVNFQELKDHLRLTDASQDSLLLTYAKAAIDLVEIETCRALIRRTFRYETSRFPESSIQLPVAPLFTVQSVQYYDSSGNLSTVDPALYTVDATSILGRVNPTLGSVWPPTQFRRTDAVRVNFTAGYADTSDGVPAGLKMIVLYLAGHFFVNRVPVSMTNVAADIPYTLRFAMDAYKIWKA